MIEYTTVLGVDRKHLCQLKLAWPNWCEQKPSILKNRLVIFYDAGEPVDLALRRDILKIVEEHPFFTLIPWGHGTQYQGEVGSRWHDPQRHKMLAGFVHVPAAYVSTPYWLKLDLDTIADGMDDWVDPKWFENSPAIIAHPWGYTKPANQMLLLDEWSVRHHQVLSDDFVEPRLNLVPKSESSGMVKHRRIISWCGFFDTNFTRRAASSADITEGYRQIPVPSQDGYLWYYATRCGLPVLRVNMKSRGWHHKSNLSGMKRAIEEI